RLGSFPGQGAPLRSIFDEPTIAARPFVLFEVDRNSNADGTPSEGCRVVMAGFRAATTDAARTVETLLATEIRDKWPDHRAYVVDHYAVGQLARHLPGAAVHVGAYVNRHDGATSQQFEVDGVLLFDDCAIFVEGKGAPFKLAGRRGSVESYRRQL